MNGSDLRAKLTITADAKSVVGASKETEAALAGVKAKARDAGDTMADTAAKFDAGAVALKGQTSAAAQAEAALAKTGAARRVEVEAMSAQAAAGDHVIGKVRAMSAAHAEYNATINAARGALAAKNITEAEYSAVTGAASAKLAVDLVAARKEATATGMALDELEVKLAKLGKFGGVSRGVISRTRAGLSAIPDLAKEFPIASAATAAAAAVVALMAAEESYARSVGRLNVSLQAHGISIAATSKQYSGLTAVLSQSGDVSSRTAREVAAAFTDANIDTSLWPELAKMSRDYAAVLGTDVAQAAAKAADELKKPSEFAKQLTQDYGLLDQATLRNIKDLEQSGRITEAQKIITDAWSDRINNAAEQTGYWSRKLREAKASLSDLWDVLGRSMAPDVADVAALNKELADAHKGIGRLGFLPQTGFIPLKPRPIKDIQDDLAKATKQKNEADRKREADDLSDLINGMGLSSYDEKLRTLENQRKRVIDDYAKGIGATGADGKALSKDQAVAVVDREIAKARKERADASRNLNEVEKEHYERIKDLLKDAPQVIAEGELDARTARGRAEAYRNGSVALQDFNDQQEIAKATLPYVTALAWADEAAHSRLASTIARVTKEKKEQLAADHALEAMQNIDQQIGSASGLMANAMADAKLAVGRKEINEWYEINAKKLEAAGLSWDEYHEKLDLLMGHKLTNLYEEDLRNRQDWASGIMRANSDILRSNQDWASKSEGFLRGWAQTGEDTFANFAKTGKLSFGGLTDFILDQFSRMVYQKYISGAMNSIGGGILDTLGGFLGMSGGGASFLSGIFHTGGDIASPVATREVPSSLFYGAPRYHGGGPILGPGEVPIIAKDDEWVLTKEQRTQSDQVIDRWEAALSRPTVLQLPAGAGAGMGSPMPKIEFHNHGEPLQATQQYDASANVVRVDVKRDMGKAFSSIIASGGADKALKRYGAAPILKRRS
jgi:hypothetical protein